MGTPHQGGNGVQLGRLLVNVASLFVAADDRLLRHLERDSEWLQQQLGQYGPISGDFVTKFAFEEYKTPTAFGEEPEYHVLVGIRKLKFLVHTHERPVKMVQVVRGHYEQPTLLCQYPIQSVEGVR